MTRQIREKKKITGGDKTYKFCPTCGQGKYPFKDYVCRGCGFQIGQVIKVKDLRSYIRPNGIHHQEAEEMQVQILEKVCSQLNCAKLKKMHEKLNKLDVLIDGYQHDREELRMEILAEYG